MSAHWEVETKTSTGGRSMRHKSRERIGDYLLEELERAISGDELAIYQVQDTGERRTLARFVLFDRKQDRGNA